MIQTVIHLFVCSTCAWRPLYDSQLLGEGQLQSPELALIQAHLLFTGPGEMAQGVEGRHFVLKVLRCDVGQIELLSFLLEVSRWVHLFVALYNVPAIILEL